MMSLTRFLTRCGGAVLVVTGCVTPGFAQVEELPIRIDQAIAIARQRIPNQMIVEAELERSEDNAEDTWVWEITFAHGVEVEVDARTGQIRDIDWDD